MNKKHYTYTIFLVPLLIYQSSFTMQSPLSHAITFSTVYSALGYGIAKGIALWKMRTNEDAPYNVQTWARDILTKINIPHANSIPLKLDNGWCVYGGYYIQIDRNVAQILEKNLAKELLTPHEEKERALAEKSLLHEAKHYQNSDFGKGILTYNFSIIPLVFSVFSSVKKTNYCIPNAARFLIAIGLPIANYITCKRYQEAEADRFAFMNLSSIKKLEINRAHKLENANLFESNLIDYPYSADKNWLHNIIRPILSNKINHLDQNSLKKNILISIANFMHDHQHPSFRGQVAIADECLKKRYIIENHS